MAVIPSDQGRLGTRSRYVSPHNFTFTPDMDPRQDLLNASNSRLTDNMMILGCHQMTPFPASFSPTFPTYCVGSAWTLFEAGHSAIFRGSSIVALDQSPLSLFLHRHITIQSLLFLPSSALKSRPKLPEC